MRGNKQLSKNEFIALNPVALKLMQEQEREFVADALKDAPQELESIEIGVDKSSDVSFSTPTYYYNGKVYDSFEEWFVAMVKDGANIFWNEGDLP